MARWERLKFTVFYDDERLTESSKKVKDVVVHMVEYLETELQRRKTSPWRGFYKPRDTLPGDSKLKLPRNVIQRAENAIFIVSPEFLMKRKWLEYWHDTVKIFQNDRQNVDGTIITLFFNVEQQAKIDATKLGGPLGGSYEKTILENIPDDYKDKDNTKWIDDVLEKLIEGSQMPRPTMPTEWYFQGADTSGRCVIICNNSFEDDNVDMVTGTEQAKCNLEELFSKQLKYNVIIKDNLPSDDMLKFLKAESENEADHEKVDAFVLIILSHGKRGYVLGADGRYVSLEEIGGHFKKTNCRSLVGKPKAFIVETCQGGDDDSDVSINADEHDEVDQVWAMATVAGQVAYYIGGESWYITDFIKAMEACTFEDDFLGILTNVCRGVTKREAKDGGHVYKQLPIAKSTLLKKWRP